MRKQRRALATWLNFVDCTGTKAFVELTVTKTIRAGAQNLLMVKTDHKPQWFSFYRPLQEHYKKPLFCTARRMSYPRISHTKSQANDFMQLRGIEWCLRASASMRAECLFLGAGTFDRQLKKFCEHPSNFCEQFEQRPNFASTFNLNETFS